eukprot:TRINITY_DN6841_c0_g1_i5.p1 TRINITY_DN6841_c0_g1~~TRINITY_DN6841_c0_g1_i5.p1  ORF type:complete len:898 (-),score=219.15 TRINITY_DN6841_c0_g1_i5:408-3101(-)
MGEITIFNSFEGFEMNRTPVQDAISAQEEYQLSGRPTQENYEGRLGQSMSKLNSFERRSVRPLNERGANEMMSFHVGSAKKKLHSPEKSSKEVMQRVFDDQELSLTSPSQQRVLEQEEDRIIDQMQAITNNLARIDFTTLSPNRRPSVPVDLEAPQEFDRISRGSLNGRTGGRGFLLNVNENGASIDQESLEALYLSYLEKVKNEAWFLGNDLTKKIQALLGVATSGPHEEALGAAVHLLHVVIRTKEILQSDQVALILSGVFAALPSFARGKEQMMMIILLEIIALLGGSSIALANIGQLVNILLDTDLPLAQRSAFLALYAQGTHGFSVLVNLAAKEFDEFVPLQILNWLAETHEIRTRIIIPSLLNDLALGDQRRKMTALAALNRLGSLVAESGGLSLLMAQMGEAHIDRNLVAATIRSCGHTGEMALVKLLRGSNSSSSTLIRKVVCFVLGWRVPADAPPAMRVSVVPYQVAEHYHLQPGTMCLFKGKIAPMNFGDTDKEESTGTTQEEETLEVNSRDFTAALQRYLVVRQSQSREVEEEFVDVSHRHVVKNQQLKFLFEEGEQNADESYGNARISAEVVRALVACLSDENPGVREAAANTLGTIGAGEALSALEPLAKALNDGDANVRAMATWAIGRLGPDAGSRCLRRLCELLRDNYWKVRTAACISIGQIGQGLNSAQTQTAYTALSKVLKDSSINKLTVCETIVTLGVDGEALLLNVMKTTPAGNYKLKAAVIQSLELANVTKPTIDFVIEELFRHSSDAMIEVRRACLSTLEVLRRRSRNNVTYLKPKNILPLFYNFLQDSAQEIRELAVASIAAFGPQGELVFIEGLTKDRNATIRVECAKGLGMMGVQTFRALLFGLRDVDEAVRKATSQTLRSRFAVADVIAEYK